ncbi:MAG TPA: hypothetical protein VMM78_09615 [Thermomicrobiales bacterium]|nr:hypothetical protein [Thermomicrobiales bacterium]
MSSYQHSFVVRCWHLGSRDERIEIEHVQSGRKQLARSTAEALDWISSFADVSESHATPAVSLTIKRERVH